MQRVKMYRQASVCIDDIPSVNKDLSVAKHILESGGVNGNVAVRIKALLVTNTF